MICTYIGNIIIIKTQTNKRGYQYLETYSFLKIVGNEASVPIDLFTRIKLETTTKRPGKTKYERKSLSAI